MEQVNNFGGGMRKLKASARVWVLVVALVVLAAAAGYYFYTNNKANADVASTATGSYHFEVVSGNTYTLQSIGNDANSVANSWKIKEAVPMRSGFGLRVRSNSTNQIVTKNLDWAVYSTEGSFPLLQNKSLMAIYPASAGTHQISVQVGTGSNIKKLTLMFSTVGLASVTPSATVTSTANPISFTISKNGQVLPGKSTDISLAQGEKLVIKATAQRDVAGGIQVQQVREASNISAFNYRTLSVDSKSLEIEVTPIAITSPTVVNRLYYYYDWPSATNTAVGQVIITVQK